MVFFTCNICGESVKKPSVEKHYLQRCRGAEKNVSCMDCQKDFFGEEYVAHTKCISEAEKYSGKDYVPKESKNSNAKKQESWMDIIRAILESSEYNLTSSIRNAFQRLQSVDNVPRKKAKFENFVANCMHMPRNQATQVWQVLEKELEKMKQAKQAAIAQAKLTQQANGAVKREAPTATADEQQPPAKKTKAKQGAEPPKASESAILQVPVSDFEWHNVLAKIVAKHNEGIALEKLKKKLRKKYTKTLDTDTLSEKQTKKFEKKFSKQLKKCANLQVDNDLVKAC